MNARRACIAMGLGVLCVAGPVRASGGEGTAVDAQPGLYRVGLGAPARTTLAGTVGYGFTEPQGDSPGAHHRLSLRLAGAAALFGWLNIAPALGIRQDLHTDDSSTVIDASLAARAFTAWRTLRLGAELKTWVPGTADASTLADTLSLDTRTLFAVDLEPATIALSLGYRFDRSAAAGENAGRLGLSDRMALGLSSFDAVLIGVGSGVHFGPNELFGEVSADVLIGAGAPSFAQSPLRVSGGMRRALTSRLTAELLVDVSLSDRPAFDASALVPIEPRISTLLGARYRFGGDEPVAPPARATLPPPAAKPATTMVELSVVDEEGVAIPNAKIVFVAGGVRRELPLDESGRRRDEHAAVGQVRLACTAPGFEPAERTLVLQPGGTQSLKFELKALPPPSQVRGTVRSFGGAGLVARVLLQPLGLATVTSANGEFTLDVPPGRYEVLVEADGYQSQRRKISVDPQGVVILNADLPKKP